MTAEARQTVPQNINPEAVSGAILARVELLTLAFGIVGTAWAAWHWGWRGAAGAAIGAALSWINFRWLKGSVRSFGRVAVAQGVATAPEPATDATATRADPAGQAAAPAGPSAGKSAYFKFIGRYILLLGGVYVILTRTSLPTVSVFVGLFAVPAGVVAGAVYELVSVGIRQAVSPNS